jgi:uncharacterized protein YegL
MPRFNANSGDYTVEEAKPMPLILLLDTSGSMMGDKIAALNNACSRMVKKLKEEAMKEVKVVLTVITFGNNGVQLVTNPPHQDVAKYLWQDLYTDGNTPMGIALTMAKDLIEDKETTPSRIYRPLVVLVSDGVPTDSWEQPLEAFIGNGRSSKCDRLAMGIMCHTDVLDKFVNGTGNAVIAAKDADDIIRFFKFVTMSVTQRSHSKDPNQQASKIVSIAKDANKSESNNQPSEPLQDDDIFDF